MDATVRAASGPSGLVTNLGSGCEVSGIEVFREVAAATGYSEPPVHAAVRSGEVLRICMDPSVALRSWGWRATVPLPEGVSTVVEHVESGRRADVGLGSR